MKQFIPTALGIMAKVSGEKLAGRHETGIDEFMARKIAEEMLAFQSDTGVTPVLLPGGGNFVRGRDHQTSSSVLRAEADYEGMIGTAKNAEALAEALRELGHQAICLLTLSKPDRAPDQRHLDLYDRHIARDYLNLGRIVVLGGGTGKPYCSTDLACVMLGGDVGVERIMKGTNAPGVYNGDPRQLDHTGLRLFRTLGFKQALEAGYDVLEASAWATALSGPKLPITVYDMNQPGNMLRAYRGEIGTVVSADGEPTYWDD